MNSIGATLKSLRLSKNYSADYVVSKLKSKNIVISAKTLYGYENGTIIRSATFLALCEIYGVTDIAATFLPQISPASHDWAATDYEDYFNGRNVNEKYEILSALGTPSFSGYEQQCSSDVFFGRSSPQITPDDCESKLLDLYRKLNSEGQSKLLDYADDLVSSGKYIKSSPSDLGQKQA